MCNGHEDASPMNRFLTAVFSGSASTTAKAAPGIGVTAWAFMGLPLETWVTVLTIIYLLFMCIGAMPKVCETFRYFYRRLNPTHEPPSVLEIIQKPNGDVAGKIGKVRK